MVTRILEMPRLGETMEEGRIVSWVVKPGENFRRGDILLEIETDKTVVEYPALLDGRLEEVLAGEGDTIPVGGPLARLNIAKDAEWSDAMAQEPRGENAAAATPPSRVMDLAMPRLGETMEEGRIVRWLKKVGDTFRRGEAIIDIETDKTVAEYPAVSDGQIVEILRGQDEIVRVGEPIARIAVQAEPPGSHGDGTPQPQPSDAPSEGSGRPLALRPSSGRVRATPLARRLARQHDIDLVSVTGSGRRGRIEKADVLAVIARRDDAAVVHDDELSYLDVPGGRLAYSAKGPANGPVTVLLHGFAADHSVWSGLAAGLARAGQRVIAPDLAGHGATTVPAGSASALCLGLRELLAREAKERPVRLVAHSLGTVPAADLAANGGARIEGMLLIAPAGIGLEIDSGFIRGMANATTPGEIAHLLRRLSRDLALSSTAIEHIAKQMRQRRLTALAEDVIGASGQRIDVLPRLAELSRRMPVRVVVGLEDRIIPWQQITALPPSVAVHLMGRSGHMPQWDQTGDLLGILCGPEPGD